MSLLDVLVYAVTFTLTYALLTVGAEWIGQDGSMLVFLGAVVVVVGYPFREFLR